MYLQNHRFFYFKVDHDLIILKCVVFNENADSNVGILIRISFLSGHHTLITSSFQVLLMTKSISFLGNLIIKHDEYYGALN